MLHSIIEMEEEVLHMWERVFPTVVGMHSEDDDKQ